MATPGTFLEETNGRLFIYNDVIKIVAPNTICTLFKKELGGADSQVVKKMNEGSFSLVNNVAYRCPPGCISCLTAKDCKVCADGYSLD